MFVYFFDFGVYSAGLKGLTGNCKNTIERG